MSMQVLLGDRSGRIIAQVKPEIKSVNWRLNEIPQLSMRFSKKDAKVTESNLQYGNRVLIKFSSDIGLPYWGGVIDPPAEWDESSVTVTAWGIEYLLQFRTTPKTRAFNDDTVGRILYYTLYEANQDQDMGLYFGSIWGGGRGHSPRYHGKTVWSIVKDCTTKLERCDIRFIARQDGDFIKFRVDVHEKAGQDNRNKFAFREGKNVSEVVLTEQGPIINKFMAIGAGTDWGESRQHSVHYDRVSDQKYGLREASKVYPDVTMESTLIRYAHTEIRDNAEPHTRIALKVGNARPARFVDYDLGDVIGCTLPSYGWNGFDAPVRVLAREYDTTKGSCTLVVEEEKFVAPVNVGWDAVGTSEA